jgi:hypothetical protein
MGEGERAEAARGRRSLMLVAASAVIAVVLVGGTALFKQDHGHLAPAWAIACTALYALAIVASGWFACRMTDEVEARHNIQAVAIGGGVYCLVYPSWYFLWRGELVPEPSHEILYLVTIATITAAYVWKKIR